MADRKTTSVDALYTEGRHYPRGQNRDAGSRRSTPHETPMESAAARNRAFNYHVNQDPVSEHGPGYSNDTSGWVRGARGEPTGSNETATNKPSGFDRGNSWRMKDFNNWNSGHDPAVIRRPEPNKP